MLFSSNMPHVFLTLTELTCGINSVVQLKFSGLVLSATCPQKDISYQLLSTGQSKVCLDANVPCSSRGICQRDWTGRVRCLCPTCHGMGKDLLGNPVCASDGNTWPSECHVRAEACAANRDLRILHEGPCGE